jgi:hypothetical protein
MKEGAAVFELPEASCWLARALRARDSADVARSTSSSTSDDFADTDTAHIFWD